MANKNYWVYILHCENDSYYTGYTDNLEKRYRSHLNGTGRCKYTRSFKPLAMAQCWIINNDKLLALQIEREIKKLTKKQKMALITDPARLSTNPEIQPFPPIPVL